MGLLFPIYGKIKHVPNHQPDYHRSKENPIVSSSHDLRNLPQLSSQGGAMATSFGCAEKLGVVEEPTFGGQLLVWAQSPQLIGSMSKS